MESERENEEEEEGEAYNVKKIFLPSLEWGRCRLLLLTGNWTESVMMGCFISSHFFPLLLLLPCSDFVYLYFHFYMRLSVRILRNSIQHFILLPSHSNIKLGTWSSTDKSPRPISIRLFWQKKSSFSNFPLFPSPYFHFHIHMENKFNIKLYADTR